MPGDGIPWRPREDAVLVANWPQKNDREIALLLARRTVMAIRWRRREIGLVKRRVRKQPNRTEFAFSCTVERCPKVWVSYVAFARATPEKAARGILRGHLERIHRVSNERTRSLLMDEIEVRLL